jgi:hypothetical protein
MSHKQFLVKNVNRGLTNAKKGKLHNKIEQLKVGDQNQAYLKFKRLKPSN